MCARITLAELEKPLRFCNRYVSTSAGQGDDGSVTNAVLGGASNDLGGALATIDAYTGKPPTVTGVNVLLKVHRGADQAFIRDVTLPGARAARPAGARAGRRCSASAATALTRTYTLRIPGDAAQRQPARCASSAPTPTRARAPSRRSSSATRTRRTRAAIPARRRSRSSPRGPRDRSAATASALRIGRSRDAGLPRRRLPHLRPGRDDGPRVPPLISRWPGSGRRCRAARARRSAAAPRAARRRTPRPRRPSSPRASRPASPRP